MTTVLSIALAVESKDDSVKFVANLEKHKLEIDIRRSEDVIWYSIPEVMRRSFYNQAIKISLNDEQVFEYKYSPQVPKLSIHGFANIIADIYADLKLGAFTNEELEPLLVSLYTYITELHPKDYVARMGFKTIPLDNGTWAHLDDDGVTRYSVKRKLADKMLISKLCKFQNTPFRNKNETIDQSINFDIPISGEAIVHYFEKNNLDEQDYLARELELDLEDGRIQELL